MFGTRFARRFASLYGPLGALLGVALLVAACSPGGQPTGGAAKPAPAANQGQAPITLKVGTLPILELLPLFVGKEEGVFKSEGLELELTTLAGGAAGIPALESGSLNIMYSNLVSVLQAVEQGLDLRIVAPGSLNAVNPHPDVTRYLVLEDSGIEKLADLRGKRLATNTLRNVNDLYATAMLDRVGVKPGEFTLVEMPFPEMVDALLNRQVDAITEVEPFIAILLGSGKVRDLGSAYYDVHPRYYLAHYVALQRWLDRNPDAARRFQRAYFKSVELMNRSRDKWGDWAVQHVRLRPELKDQVTFPEWNTLMEGEYVTSLQRTRDLMLRYDYLKQNIEPQTLIFK